jgi:uncharacterized protein YukE
MVTQGRKPKRRRRALVWPLIVLASVLLIFSITANWVQSALLDTNQVVGTTDEILKDEDVQQQLSTFAVNQLYANVDVQGQIAEKLPSSAQALAAPIAALSRGAATNVAENALSSPEVQGLVTTAVGGAHAQFVSLIRDKSAYISTTTNGEVTLEYGSVVADLATRLGVDPATISNIQGVVQEYTTDLKQRLTTVQAQIKSVRAALAQAQGGELSPEVKQEIRTLHQNAVDLRATIADLQTKIKGVLDKVPSALQSRLSDLDARLSDLDVRLAAMEQRTGAVLIDPSQANAQRLDAPLASLQARVDTALGLQAVQSPGELVVMKSSQLSGVQTIVGVLRNLGIVLPLLVLLLYVGAIYLAKGWRRQALIRAGAGILGATLLLLLVTRLIGHAVVNSEAVTETAKPAISSVWGILSDGLRERARFVLVIGLAFIGGGILAGPGPHATAVRRFLAPYMRDQPVAVYAVVAALFLLWLAFIPGINNIGQVLAILILVVLAVVGVEILRRQTAQEFPPADPGPTG